MISIDWQQVIGYLLVIGGGIAGVGGGAYGLREAWKLRSGKPSAAERLADDLPPAGSVDWAVDICQAMGAASAETKLKAILGGATRDDARKLRIAELEAKP